MSSKVVCAGNGKASMEARDHHKNGVSPKNHRSRGNVLNYFVVVVLFVSFSSCSSPESDGIKAAKMKYNYENDYNKKGNEIGNNVLKETNKIFESYIKNFDSYSFNNRNEAREKLKECLENSKEIEKMKKSAEKLEEDYKEQRKKSSEYYDKLNEKYATNREKEEKFRYAYNNYEPKKRVEAKPNDNESSMIINNRGHIDNLIQSIIPPKPDLERLKNDLIGRAVVNQTTGYSNWTISSVDDLRELEVINITDNGKEILFDTQMRLQKNNQWDAKINVRYVLPDNEDWWKLQTFNSQMNIVRTGKYDNCIKPQFVQERVAFRGTFTLLYFVNNCDETLFVYGTVQPFQGDDRTFSISIPAKSTYPLRLSGNSVYSPYVKEIAKPYEIQFIEQVGL